MQNFDSESKLHQIAFYTAERSLRDFLVKELTRRNALKADELDMVEFVRQMEALYTCPSFDIACLLRQEESRDNKYVVPVLVNRSVFK